MTRYEMKFLCDNIIEGYRDLVTGLYPDDTMVYFIMDTYCVDISVTRNSLGDIEYCEISFFENGLRITCTEMSAPIKEVHVVYCLQQMLHDRLPKGTPIDLSLCGISRPVVDEPIYRMAGLSLDYIYSSCGCVLNAHPQLLKEAVLSCVVYEE